MPKTSYPRLSFWLPPPLLPLIQLMGRRTLELYVLHLIVFKLVAMHFGLGLPIYGWFDWEWLLQDTFAKLVAPQTL